MAMLLWGKVYYRGRYAGELRQEPGGGCVFTYDRAYVETPGRPISHILPVRTEPHRHGHGLHPFFDNLVAEGWLRSVQARALGSEDRFRLLLAFGRDCAGAVWVEDPDPLVEPTLDLADPEGFAALTSRASLSGIQPKLFLVSEGGAYRPTRAGELSTHFAKLPSGSLTDIVELELLTTEAVRTLLPDDETVEVELASLPGIAPRALVIRRFDREAGKRTRHFEEFSQLLGRPSGEAKYDAAYEDMARFIRDTPACIPAEAERLFRRVLTCLLVGNTDAHLKNFAMFHEEGGLRLAPSYDLVASAHYREYQTLALSVAGAKNLRVGDLRPKHIMGLGQGYSLSAAVTAGVVGALGRRLDAAARAVRRTAIAADATALGDELIERMRRRWNGTFASIGSSSSTRPSAAARSSG